MNESMPHDPTHSRYVTPDGSCLMCKGTYLDRVTNTLRAEVECLKLSLERRESELSQSQKEATEYRKILWVLARDAGLSLHVPMSALTTIPDNAELLSWHEPLFDAMLLKGICEHADCDPKMNAKPVK